MFFCDCGSTGDVGAEFTAGLAGNCWVVSGGKGLKDCSGVFACGAEALLVFC